MTELRRLEGLVSAQLGIPPTKAFFALCHQDAPFDRVLALLDADTARSHTTLSLAGQRGTKPWYASVQILRGDIPDKKKGAYVPLTGAIAGSAATNVMVRQ